MTAPANRYSVIGRSLPGVDSKAKLTGVARFTGDLQLPGMLHGKVLRSPHAHARVLAIDVDAALAMPGVIAVATGADLDGLDPNYGMFIRDQPVLACGKVRFIGDPVAAVAAVDETAAYRALHAIRIVYEPLPSVMTIGAALAPDAPPLFDARHDATLPPPGPGASWVQEPRPNVLFEYAHRIGEDVLDGCAHVFEDRFTFARLSHYALEPHVTLAAVAGDCVEVWSNNQDPFLLRGDIARIFHLPLGSVRFHGGLIGGGFGSKSYCKIEPIAVLLARKAGRPVRLSLAMDESMMTVCEHAAEIVLRTGVNGRHETVARTATVHLDGGAYADASPSVAMRVGGRFGGPYRWQSVRARVEVIRTNTVPAGSFRGFGAAHVAWASESQMDMIARRLDLDPIEFRLRNFIATGGSPVPGEAALDCDLHAGLDFVARRIGYRARQRRPGRGIGVAVTIKSSGAAHRSDASVRIVSSGHVRVASGVSEIGQSNRIAMVQIVAEVLGVDPDAIAVADTDTDASPYDSGTHASAGVAVAGLAMRQAAENARTRVLEFAAGVLGRAFGALTLDGFKIRHANESYELAALVRGARLHPDTEFGGDGSAQTPNHSTFWMPSWTAVEVEVDAETGAVRVRDLVTAVEVGTAINLEQCRGQAEGAAVQGLGQALMEKLAYAGDQPVNADPLGYRVPRMCDVPSNFETAVLEQGLGPGPFGAKGVGEAGNLTIPAAIANAVADAVGARVTNLPITPEKVLAAIDRLS